MGLVIFSLFMSILEIIFNYSRGVLEIIHVSS